MLKYVSVFVGHAASKFRREKGAWLVANIEQNMGWPQRKTVVTYRNRKILLLPITKSLYASAAVIISNGETLTDAKQFLMQFFSAIAWYNLGKLHILNWNNLHTPGIISKHLRMSRGKKIELEAVFFRPTLLPDPVDSEAQLALALFREGLSLNHVAYAFLSYYKIINLKHPGGQKNWIRNNIGLIESLPRLSKFFSSIKSRGLDVVEYIYKACRCAVAHASMSEPTYNPESIEDDLRFHEIKPIMHELAKLVIENEYGIKTKLSALREHHYELEGFHKLIGCDITSQLSVKQSISLNVIKIDKKISLRLWSRRKLKAFEKLSVTVTMVDDGIVTLNLTRDCLVTIAMKLDFPNEKLIFNPMTDIQLRDDGTLNAANQIVNVYQFCEYMFGNGILECWESDTANLLGRTIEYIPKIRMPGDSIKISREFNSEKKLWQNEAKRRKDNDVEIQQI